LLLRIGVLIAAIGMAVFSILTMQHYFVTNYPVGGASSICSENSPLLNCAAAASSPIAQVAQIPIGYYGLCVAVLFALGAVFVSDRFEGTNRLIALVNLVGVISLFLYSLLHVHAICPLCAGYYVSSIVAFLCLFARKRFLRLSVKHVAAFVVIAALGGWGVREYHDVRKQLYAKPAAQPNKTFTF
jgi:uncharacterized membrane protein